MLIIARFIRGPLLTEPFDEYSRSDNKRKSTSSIQCWMQIETRCQVNVYLNLFRCQTGNFTTSHPNNHGNVRLLVRDASDIR